MRIGDIHLRDAARRGDPKACLEIASRLFTGGNGFPQNHRLGLAYLQQEIDKGSNSALLLCGEWVPLDVFIPLQRRALLAQAAEVGSQGAMFKLGLWMALDGQDQQKCQQWIYRSGRDSVLGLESLLGSAPAVDVADPVAVALQVGADALRRKDVTTACACINVATRFGATDRKLAVEIGQAVQLAAEGGQCLSIPVKSVEAALTVCSEANEPAAQLALGCGYARLRFGHLPPEALTRRPSPAKAAAFLLRAANAGLREAWLHLFTVLAGNRTLTRTSEFARVFLEKAAQAQIVSAQRMLGTELLKEAGDLHQAEAAVRWLSQAAGSGDTGAQELLCTLVLRVPILPADREASLVASVMAMDEELGHRIGLARALHLTRHEAMSFHPPRDLRPWGLALPGSSKENPNGRPAPAVNPAMHGALAKVREYFEAAPAISSGLVSQRSRRLKRIFNELSLADAEFFPEEAGRTRSQCGFGRHWVVTAAPVLDSILT